MKLLEKVRLLLVAVIVLGMGFSSVKAAGVTMGGSLDLLGQVVLSGVDPQPGKSTIWNKTIRKQDIALTHFHPKFSIDISEKVDGEVMLCLTDHHRAQIWVAQMEYTPFVSEEFGDNPITFRAGRFITPFGYYNDIGVHNVDLKTISRPLMFINHDQSDIALNGGPRTVLYTPYFDTGVLFYGNKYLRGQKDNLWYGVYLTAGMYYHTNDYTGIKSLRFDQEQYHIERMGERDSNENKAIGGRTAYSLGEILTLGGSYQMGKYDPKSELNYTMSGFDLRFLLGKVNLQFEYAQSDFDWIKASGTEATSAELYTKGKKLELTRSGWYVQLDFPFTLLFGETDVAKKFEFATMFSTLKGSDAKWENKHTFDEMSRASVGVTFMPEPALKYKLEYQLTMPGDYNDTASNVAKYGEGFDNLSRINLSVGLAF